jgi:hypothetical protein
VDSTSSAGRPPLEKQPRFSALSTALAYWRRRCPWSAGQRLRQQQQRADRVGDGEHHIDPPAQSLPGRAENLTRAGRPPIRASRLLSGPREVPGPDPELTGDPRRGGQRIDMPVSAVIIPRGHTGRARARARVAKPTQPRLGVRQPGSSYPPPRVIHRQMPNLDG